MCIYNMYVLVLKFFILLRHKICCKVKELKELFFFPCCSQLQPFNPTFEMQNSDGFFFKVKLSTFCLHSNLD